MLLWGAGGLALMLPILRDSTATGIAKPAVPGQTQSAVVTAPAPVPAVAKAAPLTGDKAIDHLKATGQYESLGAAITAARYAVRTDSSGARTAVSAGSTTEEVADKAVRAPSQPPAATAANPAHGIVSTFTPEGLRLRIRTGEATDAPTLTSDWRLESLGYGAAQVAVPAGELIVTGQRAEIVRGGSANLKSKIENPKLVEWFVNTPAGLEHGFTLEERPQFGVPPSGGSGVEPPEGGTPNEDSRSHAADQPLRLVMAVSGDLVPHADEAGQRLELRDAVARTVLSYEKLKVWDATGAELPAGMEITEGRVTLAVNEATACYPLTIDPTFTQQAYLKASNTDAGDGFGDSVAISGDTVVVGALQESSNATGVNGDQSDNSALWAGAAYVFVRSGTTWSQQAYLKASNTDTGEGDEFGFSVAISDLSGTMTVVVGARAEDSNATGVNGNQSDNGALVAGAAYVFVRSGTTWSQQAYLKASNTGAGDGFGWSVAISGDTVVVGASGEDSSATGVNGNQSDDSVINAGAAYVFVRSGTTWSQQAYLKASNTGAQDLFGSSVAISGDTVVVGASRESSNATGVDGNQSDDSASWAGAAYVFVRNGSPAAWSQQAYLKASNTGVGDFFGISVAISGDTVVVGADGESSNATGVNGLQGNNSAVQAGAAYVFQVHPAGRISAAISPPGPIRVGDAFTVTFSISGYTAATEIDGVNFQAAFPSAMFSFVPGSVTFNDAAGPDENWLRLAPQDGVGAGALPLTVSAFPGFGVVEIFLSDARPASTRGTLAESGFLVSFQLHANAAGTGGVGPSAAADGTVLFGAGHTPAGVPAFSGASITVFPAHPGHFTGQVDMVGETEVVVPRSLLVPGTRVRAQNGPSGASEEVFVPWPYWGPFTLDGLAPSGSVLPERGYEVGASMNIRTGRRLETFTSPFLGQGLNPWKIVPADGTVELGTTFVMQPGFVRGAIFLQGPAELLLGHESTLRYIARLTDFDPDGDGFPDINPDGDSRVSAAGRPDIKSAGAAYSAAGAEALVSFEGEFDPSTSAFRGDYELVLAGLNGQASYWHQLGLQLLLQSGLPATPETYVREKLRITERRNPQYLIGGLEVRPAEHTTVDLNYCLSEVVIELETVFGTLWNPTVTVLNSGLHVAPPGPDFQGNLRSYQVNLDNATGTPTTRGENSRGRIVLLLPEGEYEFHASARVGNSPADEMDQVFDTFRVTVGCGERLRVSPGMQVVSTNALTCAGGRVRVDGTVQTPSGIPVRRIEWSTPGGAAHVVCDGVVTPCGLNPPFSFDLPLSDPCAGTVFTVTAYTADGASASVTRSFRDTVPPVLAVGADKTVECGSLWDFDPPVALADCNGAASVEAVSTVKTTVNPCRYTMDRTWRATDACGNWVEQTQRVTVVDTTPPMIVTSSNVEVECPGRVTLDVLVFELCGGGTTTFTPPNGSFFPVGSTEVLVRTVDACGLSAERRVTITVKNSCALAYSLGVPTKLLGGAMAEGRSDGSLHLSGMGSTLQDGLRLDPGEVAGLRVEFDRFLPANQLAGGAEFTAIARGVSGASVAALRLVRNNTFAVFEVIPSFDLPGTWDYGVRFYTGDQLTHESLGRTAPPPDQFPVRNQLFLTALPKTIRAVVRPGGMVVYECSFGEPSNLSMFTSGNALSFTADRMEIFPAGPPVAPVESLSGLDLVFSGISERIITGLAVTKFGQEIRASHGVALAGVQGGLAVGYVNIPDFPGFPTAPPPQGGPVVWNTVNPLGYFGDSLPGNPSSYNGYWEGVNPLGHAAQWDLKIDLTDTASAPLGVPRYRAGKSGAGLLMDMPALVPGATLRLVAGGVADPSPGALTVEMGSLVFEGKAGRVELGAEFYIPTVPFAIPTVPAPQRLEVTLADGSVETFEGTPEELRVSWDTAAPPPPSCENKVRIGPDGALILGIRPLDAACPVGVRLPDGVQVQATSMSWTAKGGPTWTPGSLRGLLLVGKDNPPVSITDLNTSTDNPTPASYFADHRITALGNGTFRTDAFGSLALDGLTQSGEDGVTIKGFTVTDAALPSGPWLRVNLGYLPFWAGLYPPPGALLDLRVLSEGNQVPNAVLAGQSAYSAGSPLFFGVRFPNLQSSNHTLRVFRGNAVVFDRSGRLNDPPTARGNLAPYALPDAVEARIISGRFTWVLTWNRVIAMEIYNQTGGNPFLGDRVEIADEDGTANSVGENRLEVRAGSIGTLRLLNLGNRSAPSVPELNFSVNAGRLNLSWDDVVSGRPRLQTAPRVDGPWKNLTVGIPSSGAWDSRFELVPVGQEGFTRLVTRPATEGCLEFSDLTPGDHPNPADFAGWKFDRFDPNGMPSPLNEIIELDGIRGLKFDARMDLELPLPAEAVDILFGSSGGSVTFIAFDDAGEVARKVVNPQPSGGGAEAETIQATAGRPLRRLRVLSAGGSVDLREFCLRAFPFQDATQARSCLPLRTAALGPVANPWIQGDLTITAHTADGATPPTGLITDYPNNVIVGYDVAHQVELKFAHPSAQVEIEFLSGSGSVDFQAYDDLGAALPVYHLGRVTSSYGETVVFTENPRPIDRVVITSPAGKTRLMKICGGPVPVSFCREIGDITVRPTRNPQPAGDMMWTFYDAAHVLASSTLRTNATEVGLDLTPETVIDFATDKLSAELRLVVDAGGATISVDATAWGGGTFRSLPSVSYGDGVHTLSLTDYCGTCGVGARLRHIRVRLTSGNAIVTRVYTPFPAEN